MFEITRSIWRRWLGLNLADKAGAATQDDDDRRAWTRVPVDITTSFTVTGSPHSRRHGATIRNISLGGINLVSDQEFRLGTLLSIEVPESEHQKRSDVLACVIHCARESEAEWSLGCTFSRELTSEDLDAFGARRERHESEDKREWKRFPCDLTATYQLAADEHDVSHPAKVLNVSATGVGLQTERIVENGTLLSVELHNAAGTTERTMLACVVHVGEQADGTWALGCNFIRSLDEAELGELV